MRRLAWLVVVVADLVACNPPIDMGGQSGTETPDQCVEDHRVAVTDPTVAADGFSFSAADVIASASGDYAGTFNFIDKSSAAATLSLDLASADVAAVTQHLQIGTGGGGTGAATPACDPYYAFTAAPMSFALADDKLGVASNVTWTAFAADHGNFSATVAQADVTGSSHPTFDTSRWSKVTLILDAGQSSDAPGEMSGSATWVGSNDAASSADDTDASGDTGTGTGTVGASGQTEGVGSFVVHLGG